MRCSSCRHGECLPSAPTALPLVKSLIHLSPSSFRPSLSLSFLTSELAFTDLNETHSFLEKHLAAKYVEPTPAQAMTSSSKSVSKRAPKIPLEQRQWDTKNAQAALQAARDKLRTIDVSHSICRVRSTQR